MNIKYLGRSGEGSRWLEMFPQHVQTASNINTADAAVITHLSAEYMPRRRRGKMQ
jgi:hypothetical protein